MRNEWSQIRIQHKMPGNMIDKKLAVGIPFMDANGNRVVKNMWTHVVLWELDIQFGLEKNNLLFYGRSNRNKNGEYLNFGKSGNVIRMGSGIRQQSERANTYYYSKFSLKMIEDALYELSINKLGFGERKFVLKTGSLYSPVQNWRKTGEAA